MARVIITRRIGSPIVNHFEGMFLFYLETKQKYFSVATENVLCHFSTTFNSKALHIANVVK